jgi:hypothetical protein
VLSQLGLFLRSSFPARFTHVGKNYPDKNHKWLCYADLKPPARNPSFGRQSSFWSRNKHSIEEVAARRLPTPFVKKLIFFVL